MNLPDFSDWPAHDDNDDDDDDDSIEMTASVASASAAAANANGGEEEEESWHDDDDERDEREFGRSRTRRRRRRGDIRGRCRCCPPCKCRIRPGSSPGAVANLCSATLGAGVLPLPCAIRRCGVVPGLVLLGLAAAATVGSIDIVVDVSTTLRLSTYEDLTRRLLGRRALAVVESSIFAFCFGCAVAYIVAVGDILQQGILDVFADQLPSIVTREFAMVAFWSVIMLPLILLERIDALRFASLLGVGSVAFLVLASVVHSVRDLENTSSGGDEYYSTVTNGDYYMYSHVRAGQDVRWWTPASLWDVALACPVIMFAFSCQVNVCAIYEELGGSRSSSDAGGELSAAAGSNGAADLTRTRHRGNITGPSHHPDDDEMDEDEDSNSHRKAAQMARVTLDGGRNMRRPLLPHRDLCVCGLWRRHVGQRA